MKITNSNENVFILNLLYYVHFEIETLSDLYGWVKFFNKEYSDKKLKKLTILYLQRILSDGTHYFKSNNLESGIIYSKEKGNLQEAFNFIDKYWTLLMKKIKENNLDTGVFLKDGTIVDISPYLYWTDEWKKELCQLSKLGYQNAMSHDKNCKFDPKYKYQMPDQLFIPDNDCGCEE